MTHWAFIIYLTFLLTIFEQICHTQMSVQDSGSFQSSTAFTEELNDDHTEFSLSGTQIFQELDETRINNGNTKLFLKFEPDILDFKQRTLGIPYHERVTVVNLNSNKTVIMSSISGNTVHFHSSFFEDKIIPPKGNTTFNVVFLGRQEGAIESVLLIHTSEGSVKYQVKGISTANPYRLRPLVDIRLPLNASFSPLIYMHNPHSTAIQITEVYSSGGEFHLELPTGELEGPKQMWEIPPYQTRPVIRVRFNARAEANHTAYIRIKLNRSEEVLIVPLEVEVGTFPGLHASQGGVDFGIGGSLDTPKRVKLLLHNTWKKSIRVHSISSQPNNNVVHVDFQPIKISPLGKQPTLAAYLTIDWKLAYDLKQFCGQLIVKSKQIPYDMVILYWATVFPGGLIYNASVAQYLSDKRSIDTTARNFSITNYFHVPVAVINVTLPAEAASYFKVQNFQPLVIQSNKTVNLFNLKCVQNSNLAEIHFESHIFISTNISTVKVPLLSYDGKLKMVIPFADKNETVLDLGLVSTDHVKESYIIFTNTNPVEVDLKKWSTDLKLAQFSLIGCDSGNVPDAVFNYAFSKLVTCKSVKPGEYAVFVLTLKAPSMEGQLWGELNIETQYERIAVPVTIRSAPGKLLIEPERIIFDDCFPNKICKQTLKIFSTFSKSMNFVRMNALPFDSRFFYELANKTSGSVAVSSDENDETNASAVQTTVQIVPKLSQVIANLYFDASLQCSPTCYTGFTLNSSVGTQWLKTFTLLHSTLEFDLKLLNTMYGRYLNVTSKGMTRWHNLTLRLDTTEVKGFIFNTRVKITWPKLLSNTSSENKSYLLFPTTQIGNITTQTITFYNPSTYPIILHLVMESAYPGGRKLYELLPNGFKRIYPNTSGVSPTTFYFDKLQLLKESTDFEQISNSTRHQETLLLKLDSGKSVDIKINFNATSTALKSTLLYIRNNLTIIEVVRLVGQGAHPILKFGNRKPGSNAPLMFELTDKHLKDCEKERLRKNPSPNLTVKRSFTTRNIGDVAIYIKGFYINGYPCEGFGFKVLNCEPFNLPPNETKKVDIAFTPDFTLAKIQRTLIIDTSLNIRVNYTLITTVPPYFLASCSSVLGRPSWEYLLYYISVGSMCFMLVCILIGAFLESDRIIQTTLTILNRDTFTMQQPLDLRLIGIKNTDTGSRNDTENEMKCVQNNNDTKDIFNVTKNSTNNGWTDIKGRSNNSVKASLITPNSSPPSTLISVKNAKKKIVKKNSNETILTNLNTSPSYEHQKDKKLSDKLVITNIIRNKTNASPLNINSGQRKKAAEEINNKQKISVDRQKLKKIDHNKKKSPGHVLNNIGSEEDSSSTTTEYSNNEEGDKENQSTQKNETKNRNKIIIKKLKVKNDYRDNYEGDDEDTEKKTISHSHHKQWKTKSETKSSTSLKTIDTNSHSSSAASVNLTHQMNTEKNDSKDVHKHRSNQNQIREKKEKLPIKKQRSMPSNDKLHHINGKQNTSTEIKFNTVSRTTSPNANQIIPPVNCWGETRARFSDVVAGASDLSKHHHNDSLSTSPNSSNSTLHLNNSLFSFDHMKLDNSLENSVGNTSGTATSSHAQLGPIGSKKSPVNIWETITNSTKPSSTTNSIQNTMVANDSFFANSFLESPALQLSLSSACIDANGNTGNGSNAGNGNNITVSNTTGSGGALNYAADLWNSQTSVAVMNMLQNSARSMLGDYSQLNYYPNDSWTGNNSYWGDTAYFPPPVGEERQHLHQQQQQQNHHLVGGGSGSSFWNASPWTPTTVATTAPDTPTRTPPGFPAHPMQQQRGDEIEHDLAFDPFRSLSNIWNPSRPPPSS